MNPKPITSDDPSAAGASFRSLSRSDRRYTRDSRIIMAALALLAVVWVIAASQFVWGAARLGLVIVVLAAAVASALTFVFVLRGSAAVAASGLVGAVLAVWLGAVGGLNWGFLVGAAILDPPRHFRRAQFLSASSGLRELNRA